MSVRFAFAFAGLLTMALTLGCGTNPPPKEAPKPSPSAPGHEEGDGHDHKEGEAHAHPTEGPHHGHLIELGKEEYHAELTHDDATHTVTIYILDSAAKVAVPIEEKEVTLNIVVDKKPSQFKLAATPQDGDPEGQSSRFALADEGLHESLESEKVTGRLSLSIKGKPYSGSAEHHEHGEHEQKK